MAENAQMQRGRSRSGRAIACVLGEIDLVTALGRAGISCAVAAVRGDPATHSRHTKERLPWWDPETEPETMVRTLVGWAAAQEVKPVLFFNGDHDLLMVSRNRHALSDAFRFVIAEEELVDDLVDKRRFASLAETLELPVPPSLTLDPSRDLPGTIELAYPLIVKPLRHRHEVWNPMSGGGKAMQVANEEALRKLWPRLADQGPIVVQRSIPGPESRLESYHVYVDAEGEVACEFAGRKIRTLPREYGDTTALEVTQADDVLALGRDLTERLRLTGVAKFDFKRDDSGRLWLLEVNPRFNLWHHAGAVAGANIPLTVYRDLTGEPRTSCTARAGVAWCHPTRDLRTARAEGVTLPAWLRFAMGCEVRWGGSLSDPMPFLRGVLLRRLAARVRR